MRKFYDFHLYYSAMSDKEVPLEMNLLAHIPHFEKLQPRKGQVLSELRGSLWVPGLGQKSVPFMHWGKKYFFYLL